MTRVSDDYHDMDGWARLRSDGKWHQVRRVRGRLTMLYPCMDAYGTPPEVMDYRWRPPSGERCQRPFCQVDPGP